MMPFTHYSILVAICSWLLIGCDEHKVESSAPKPATFPTLVIDTWNRSEMLKAAFGYEQARGEQIPDADLQIVKWRVIQDDRPLLVEQAVVLLKCDGGHWRLADLYRHPKQDPPTIQWRLSSKTDVPFVNHRNFTNEPTAEELEQFLLDAEWRPAPIGFRVMASN